eukprot:11194783-Lingulodinium_polyedra.AAC.1
MEAPPPQAHEAGYRGQVLQTRMARLDPHFVFALLAHARPTLALEILVQIDVAIRWQAELQQLLDHQQRLLLATRIL